MKKTTTTKTLIVVAGLCSAVCFAQGGSGGGAGGAGGNGGSSGAGSASGGTASGSTAGSSTATTNAPTASSARASGTTPGSVPSTAPTGSALATPNMNTVSPSQSVTEPGTTTTTSRSGAAPDASPLSGLPQSQIPTISVAPPPIAADGSITPKQDAGSSTAKSVEPIVPAGANSLPADRKMSRTAVGDTAGKTGIGPAPAVKVTSAPPAAMRESTPSTSNEGHVWVPGHYTWTGERWNWTFGSWERPPMPGATWMPGNYDAQGQRWTPGYWNPGAGAPTGR